MGKVKIWNSRVNDWWDVAHNTRIWNGHSWQKAKIRGWDGHRWVMLSEERHVDTWEATGSWSYWSNMINGGAAKGFSALVNPKKFMAAGCYSPNHDVFDRGDEGSMMWFNDGDIRNKLSGARIESVKVYLCNAHWYYYSGGVARVGTHNERSGWSDRFQEANGLVAQRRMAYGEGAWIDLPTWVGDNFRDNKLSGLTVRGYDLSHLHYGYYYGAHNGWRSPKLQITYWK